MPRYVIERWLSRGAGAECVDRARCDRRRDAVKHYRRMVDDMHKLNGERQPIPPQVLDMSEPIRWGLSGNGQNVRAREVSERRGRA